MADIVIMLIHAKLFAQGLACRSMLNKLIGKGKVFCTGISHSHNYLRLNHIIQEAKLGERLYCRAIKRSRLSSATSFLGHFP